MNILSVLPGFAMTAVILAVGFGGLWCAFGRKKHSEDRSIGLLKQLAVFRGAVWPTNMTRCK